MSKIKLELKDGTRVLATFDFAEKQFKMGSRGFHSQGKVELDGKRYQANFLLVEIGSKPKKGLCQVFVGSRDSNGLSKIVGF